MAIRHVYSQTVADGTATSVVRPSDWNSAHNQTLFLAGNTSGASSLSGSDIYWAGGSNVTLSANGSTVSVIGVAAQTNQTQASGAIAGTGFTSTSTAGSLITAALGTNGLTMAVPAFLTTTPAQTVDTNKAGTGFTSTTTAGSLITAALGTNGLTMAVPQFITTYAAQTTQTQPAGNIAGVGTTTGATNASVTLNVNSNGVALSVSAAVSSVGTINQTGPNIGVSNLGNTLGSTGTVSTGNVVFVGGSGVTLSQSTAAAGSNATITIIGNTPPIMSRGTFPNYAEMTFLSAPVNASASMNAVTLPIISGTRMDILLYQSLSSSATANTYGQQWSIYMGIYSNDTLNSRLVSLSSGSTQTTYTVASNTAGVTQLNGSAIRPISCPVNFSATPGEYFIAVNYVTNTLSSGTATTALNRTVSIVGNLMQSASWAIAPDYTVASAATNNSLQPAGVFSAASTGLPGTISYSQLAMTGASRLQANFVVVMRNN